MSAKSTAPVQEPDPKKRMKAILRVLDREFPGASTPLNHGNPFQLLVATILSAQCTDQRVNLVTKDLFKKYRTVKAFASVSQAELEKDIHSTGFFRMKAKNIIAMSRALIEQHKGTVPATMDLLVKLPGVGRKTANVVLSEAFGMQEGIVVDTHVHRLSHRLGFSTEKDPVKVEQDLMAVAARKEWGKIGLLLILHGRKTCNARKPACGACSLASQCPSRDAFAA